MHQPQRRLSYQPTHRTSVNIIDEKSAARHYFAVPFPSNGSSGSMTLQYLERSEHNAGPALRICVLCGLCEYADHQGILSTPLQVIAQTPAFNRRTFHEHLICTALHGSSTMKSRQELSVPFPGRPVSHPLWECSDVRIPIARYQRARIGLSGEYCQVRGSLLPSYRN